MLPPKTPQTYCDLLTYRLTIDADFRVFASQVHKTRNKRDHQST